MPFRSLTVLPDANTVAQRAAAIIGDLLRGPPRRVRVVLAGGTTPRLCYERLAATDLPWGHAEILFGDERCVRPDHPDSNFRMANESLLRVVSAAAVRRIPAELGAEVAADLYSTVVAEAPLDLVLLGIGPDGHTASLFPGHAALAATGLTVPVHDAPKPPLDRVSLTLRAINSARRVLILATGRDKAEAVRRARDGVVPAGLIEDADWLVSADAAAEVAAHQ